MSRFSQAGRGGCSRENFFVLFLSTKHIVAEVKVDLRANFG